MERAGDVLADVLGERIVVLHQRREIDAPVGERREDRAGERRHEIDQRGDDRALHLVRGVDAVEPAQPVGELHREGHAAHGAHLLVRQHVDGAAEALHEALEVELVAGEVEFDQRRRGGVALASETRPRAIGLSNVGARLATWKPSGLHEVLHCTLMYMSSRRRARQPGGIAERRHRMRPQRLRPAARRGSAASRRTRWRGSTGSRRRPADRRAPRCRARADGAAGPMPERIRNAGEWMPPSRQDDLARGELLRLAADP